MRAFTLIIESNNRIGKGVITATSASAARAQFALMQQQDPALAGFQIAHIIDNERPQRVTKADRRNLKPTISTKIGRQLDKAARF